MFYLIFIKIGLTIFFHSQLFGQLRKTHKNRNFIKIIPNA